MLKKAMIMSILVFCVFSLFSIDIITGEKNIKEDRTLEKDLIMAGQTVEFLGNGKALYLFGQDVLMSGKSSDSLVAIGKDIDVTGNVGNHLYSIGQMINIKGELYGTSFFAGEELIIDKNSVINGDLFFAGSALKIFGKVNGDIFAGSGRVVINGIVTGNMRMSVRSITINNEGRVNGNIYYISDTTLSKNELERVNGKTEFKKGDFNKGPHKNDKDTKKGFKIFHLVVSIFMSISFIIAGLLILLLPASKKFEISRTSKEFWEHLIWGLIPFFIYPVAVIILMVLVITFPLGLGLLLIAFPMLLLTELFGAILFGQFLFNIFKWNNNNRFLFFLFGSLFFIVLSSIPFLGFLTVIFFSSVGYGFILSLFFRKNISDTNLTAI